MTTVEVRAVVRVVREPLWRGVLAALVGDWVLAVFGGEVARAGELCRVQPVFIGFMGFTIRRSCDGTLARVSCSVLPSQLPGS